MSELRKHYFRDEYCIIATKRKNRPSDFLLAKTVAGVYINAVAPELAVEELLQMIKAPKS
jgi:hypothetical protein